MTDEKRNLRYLYGLIGKESGPNPIFLIGHPIGSVYITTNNDESTAAQMATKYGGTWVAASEGRAIFGAGDNGQTSIAFGDKLGDAYLQAHTHVGGSHTHTLGAHRHESSNGGGFMVNTGGTKNLASGTSTNREIVSYTNYAGGGTTSGASAHNTGAANGSTGNDNNFPPYEAFYVYKRTA